MNNLDGERERERERVGAPTLAAVSSMYGNRVVYSHSCIYFFYTYTYSFQNICRYKTLEMLWQRILKGYWSAHNVSHLITVIHTC